MEQSFEIGSSVIVETGDALPEYNGLVGVVKSCRQWEVAGKTVAQYTIDLDESQDNRAILDKADPRFFSGFTNWHFSHEELRQHP